ncbi:ketopantoate reductase family protein [Rathayibacter sp. CAU 1779]
MRILMFGRGVIATIYGWALEQAGHDVEFYVRPGRAASYGPTVGLDLVDGRQGLRERPVVETWPVRYREELEPGHDFDLILLSVAHSQLTDAAQFLAPRLGRATVLVFGNIWSEPLDAVAPLPADRLAWGFPQAGGGFDGSGTLTAMLLPSVLFGTLDGAPSRREHDVRQAFRDAGLRIREVPDFRGWLWLHFIADAGMHSQGLLAGTLSKLVGSRAGLREALLTTRELIPLLEARGIDLRRHRRGLLLYRAPATLTSTALAWATAHIPGLSRSLRAHADPDAREPHAVCRDTLTEARRLGIPAPRLEAAEAKLTSRRATP